MEDIIKIIFDYSYNYKILDYNSIREIVFMVIYNKKINKYLSDIDVQEIRSKKLASYSSSDKKITIYSNIIEIYINNIKNNYSFKNEINKYLFLNLSIFQILLHEVEHANQLKIVKNENNLEMLLLKTGELLKENKQSYELKPSERFAEIKSYDEIYYSLGFLTSINHGELVNHISNERMIRKMRGYRIKNKEIIFPTKEYFEKGECGHLYNSIEDIANFNICKEKYSLDERLFYGVGISDDEYKDKMSKILFFTNNYCQNRMSILE